MYNFVLNLIIYFVTYLLSVYNRKDESVVTGVMMISLLLIFLHNYSAQKSLIILAYGFLMATVELTCVKIFDMWRYNNTAWVIPKWLPFGWSLLGTIMMEMCRIGAQA